MPRSPRGVVPPQFKAYNDGELPRRKPRTPDPDRIKLKGLTQKELNYCINIVLSKSPKQLAHYMKMINSNDRTTALRAWISAIALKGIMKGDHKKLDFILDRAIGKVKQKIEFEGAPVVQVNQVYLNMTPEQRQTELKKLIELEKKLGDD